MARKKVKLAFISNDSSRKLTFNKRKKGLLKKVSEISTLCGVNACAVVYGPNESPPEVWPSHSGVQQVISEFKMLPENEQQKKMVDQVTFLQQKIVKASEHLKRQKKENKELEMIEIMFQCFHGNMKMPTMNIVDLNDLGYMIEKYLNGVNHRMQILSTSCVEIGVSSSAVADGSEHVGGVAVMSPTTTHATTIIEEGSSSSSSVALNFLNRSPRQYEYQGQDLHQLQLQQFGHLAFPPVGFFEQPLNLHMNHNQNGDEVPNESHVIVRNLRDNI